MYACMYACMYVCMYVCIDVLCTYVCIDIPCTYVRIDVCIDVYIFMYVCLGRKGITYYTADAAGSMGYGHYRNL